MEPGKGAQVDLSIPGKTSLTKTGDGTVLAAVTNSLFQLKGEKVEMTNWDCDFEALVSEEQKVYAGDVDGNVWEWADNHKKELFQQEFAVVDLAIIGGVLAAATEDSHPLLYRAEEVIRLEPPHKGSVMSVTLSKGALYLASIGYDGRLMIYDLHTRSRKVRFQICRKRHEDSEEKLKGSWSPDGTSLMVPGDLMLRIVKTTDWQLLDTSLSTDTPIIALQCIDMQKVAGYSQNGSVFVWDVENKCKLQEINTEKRISDLITTNTDIVCASYEGIVYFYPSNFQIDTKNAPKIDSEAIVSDKNSDKSDKSDSESAEEISYFDACIGVLPQKSMPEPEEDAEGKVLFSSLLGTVTAKEQDGVPVIEIEIVLESNRKRMMFRDAYEFNLASMSEKGAVLAGKEHFVVFKSFEKDVMWMQEVPEEVQAVAVGETWCAAYTSSLNLRVFSIYGGVQLCVLSLPTPILTMSSYGDLLGSVHLQGLPRVSIQNLSLELRSLGSLTDESKAVSSHIDLPISPEEELVWFGFSTSGVPCATDSAGVTRVYWEKSGFWVPVLHAPDMRVIGVDEGDVYGIDEGEIVAKPFEAQFCASATSQNEGSYFINRLCSELYPSSPDTLIELEKSLINLIREAAVSGQEEKVMAYFSMARKKKTKEIAVRLLTQMQMYDLAQRLSDKQVQDSKTAIPASKGGSIPTNRPELAPKPLIEKPQISENPPSNPFHKKPEVKSDIFSSLSEVTKRKTEPLPVVIKKKRV